jgi:hypothetical protein
MSYQVFFSSTGTAHEHSSRLAVMASFLGLPLVIEPPLSLTFYLRLDRLSDQRFPANYFRLYLHAAATNLPVPLLRIRTIIERPCEGCVE